MELTSIFHYVLCRSTPRPAGVPFQAGLISTKVPEIQEAWENTHVRQKPCRPHALFYGRWHQRDTIRTECRGCCRDSPLRERARERNCGSLGTAFPFTIREERQLAVGVCVYVSSYQSICLSS